MAEYVDPINYKSNYDYNVALNEADRKSAQAEIDAAKARGVDLLNPEGGVVNDTTGNAIRLRSMLAGIHNSDDQANAATFYGLTPENYQNVLSGDMTRPMGENQSVYGAQLLSPMERIAAETARGQGFGEPNARAMELAKANPDVFNDASQRWQKYLSTTYPGTLEYQSVLSGPMQFSNAGVKYPKIDDTVSMYILDPVTNEIVKNPKYKGPKTAADGGLMSLTDSPKQSGLHQFAQQVAANGRGDDSLLVHMTPDEVRNLQRFAEANGTTLTINPETGLPEAGLLSDLFKAVAPIALGAFLGPAGFGLSAGMAGLATGGITALATGSLSRGLMAGLGAYGGAGLGGSLMNAGTASIGSAAEGIQGPIGSPESGFGATQAIAAAPKADVLSAGFNAATASPSAMGAFAKQNLGNLAYAASPILAASMVPTTTKLETPKSDNYIRQFDFNINPDTGKPDPLYGVRAMTPVKASEWGDKTLQGQRELFRQQNPNPYELGVGSLNQPPQQPARMAGGGIVALADGGLSAGAQYAATHGVDVGANVNKWIQDNPFATAADIKNALTSVGLTQDDINPYLTANTNISDATRYALSHATEMPGAGGLAGMQANILKGFATPNLTQTQIDTEQRKYGVSNADIQSPLAHGYQIADTDLAKATNYLQSNPDVQAWLSSAEGRDYIKQHPEFDASDIAYTHYKRYGEKEGRTWEEAAKKPPIVCGPGMRLNAAGTACEPIPVTPPPFTTVVAGDTQLPGATVYDNGAFGNYGSGPATGVDYKGNTVSIATPGDIITNPDDTRTVTPNLPGRPYGGFTGIEAIKSAYTAGGGSLGYTAKAPRTIAEFNQLYNKQTGDSLAAYDYLMGKGSGKYPVKSGVSEIQKPYNEFVLGKKTTKPAAKTTETKAVIGTPGQPQTYFDEAAYLAANPDVAAELKTGKSVSGQPTKFSSGYEHWLMYGKAAGRPFAGDYQGYLTAAALANAPQQGGEAPSGPSGNTSNTISGFTPAPPDASIPESSMGIGPAADGSTGSGTGTGAGDAADGGEGGTSGTASAKGGLLPRRYAMGGGLGSLGSYSDGGRLLKGPGDGVSDSIPATIGAKQQPARLADGEFVIPARIVSELGNGSTDAGAKKLYAMMDRVQKARGKTTGKNKVAANSRADKYLPA